MKAILVGPQGIQAGWRFAAFVFLLFGFSKLFFWLLTALFHYQEHVGWLPTDFLLDGTLSLGTALLAAWIMSRIERRPFHEYGLSWNTMYGKHFWQGVLWGFGASLLMVILLRLFGAASFEGVALHGQAFFKSALLWAAAFLLLDFAEEFAYRGYAQATLAEGMGFWRAALLLSALLFAQPNTGNTGQSLTRHSLNVSYHGPEWLTGGPRGTEASALEFLILAFLFLAFARVYRRLEARPIAPGQKLSGCTTDVR